MYVVALATGLLVGIIYALEVRSPAPPVVALLGLLGILLGEQAVPMAKRLLAGEPIASAGSRPIASARIRRAADEVDGSAAKRECAHDRRPHSSGTDDSRPSTARTQPRRPSPSEMASSPPSDETKT
jgi:XapX domain-containing protein